MLRIKSSKSPGICNRQYLRLDSRVAETLSSIIVVASFCLIEMQLKDWRRGNQRTWDVEMVQTLAT